MASCINLQLPIVILKKSIRLDMHHHKTYMNINYQQNRVSRSVKTVDTNLFVINRILHKLARTARQTDGRTDGWTDIVSDNIRWVFP